MTPRHNIHLNAEEALTVFLTWSEPGDDNVYNIPVDMEGYDATISVTNSAGTEVLTAPMTIDSDIGSIEVIVADHGLLKGSFPYSIRLVHPVTGDLIVALEGIICVR